MARKADWLRNNSVYSVLATIVLKGGSANGQFIGHYPQGPNINFEVMGVALQHFRREVVEGAAESLAPALGVDGPAKISNFDSAAGQQYILGFYVAVDDGIRVQVGQPLADLLGYFGRLQLAEFTHAFQQTVQFTPGGVLQYQRHCGLAAKVAIEF